jgi:hypothetical protein
MRASHGDEAISDGHIRKGGARAMASKDRGDHGELGAVWDWRHVKDPFWFW